jgi:hypothetical protein
MTPISQEDALEYHRWDSRLGKIAMVLTKPMSTQRDQPIWRQSMLK